MSPGLWAAHARSSRSRRPGRHCTALGGQRPPPVPRSVERERKKNVPGALIYLVTIRPCRAWIHGHTGRDHQWLVHWFCGFVLHLHLPRRKKGVDGGHHRPICIGGDISSFYLSFTSDTSLSLSCLTIFFIYHASNTHGVPCYHFPQLPFSNRMALRYYSTATWLMLSCPACAIRGEASRGARWRQR